MGGSSIVIKLNRELRNAANWRNRAQQLVIQYKMARHENIHTNNVIHTKQVMYLGIYVLFNNAHTHTCAHTYI